METTEDVAEVVTSVEEMSVTEGHTEQIITVSNNGGGETEDGVQITNLGTLENLGILPMPVTEIKEEPPDVPTEQHQEKDESDEEDCAIIDKETTVRYLAGQITFAEFNAMLEERIKMEPSDMDTDIAAQETVSTRFIKETPGTSTEDGQEKPRRRGRRKGASKLPADLQGLMGEANMKFALGQKEEAVKMCMEVIRLVPSASEPYQTLAMIYEEEGDADKALQFSLIAAHVQPNDSDEWVRVAEMCMEQKNLNQALLCYSKAIKYNSSNVAIWWAKCDVLEKLNDKKKAMEGYTSILSLLKDDDPDKYFQLSRDMTKTYHEMSHFDKAISTMENAFVAHPQLVMAEDVNLLLELYMGQKIYDKPVEVLIQHCKVLINLPDGRTIQHRTDRPTVNLPPLMSKPKSCVVPEDTPIDLKAKFAVCMIYLDFMDTIKDVVASLYEEDANDVGDLYLDVAEAYMEKGGYKEAKPLLAALINSENYNLAAVWLRYGECLNALGDLKKAAQAYERVVELAPTHLDARVSLSSIQQQLGRHVEALEILQTDIPTDERQEKPKIDLRLELPKCMLLLSQGKIQDFVDCCKNIMYAHTKIMFTKSQAQSFFTNKSIRHRMSTFRELVNLEYDKRIKAAPSILPESAIKVDDLWDLYIKLCNVLYEKGLYDDFEEVSIATLVCPMFLSDPTKAEESEFICMTACLLKRNGNFAYGFIREYCMKNLDSNGVWNLFSLIITLSQDIRHNRFCLRLLWKNQDHHVLHILNGHNALVAGSFKHALGEYTTAFRNQPNDPLLSLCIGLTFMHMSAQKFTTKRHTLFIQGCSFLNQYLQLRGECQESYYNLGRAMQQMGLYHAAIDYYEKGLELKPAIQGSEEAYFDLTKELAFNLFILYKNTGAVELASYVMQQYLHI